MWFSKVAVRDDSQMKGDCTFSEFVTPRGVVRDDSQMKGDCTPFTKAFHSGAVRDDSQMKGDCTGWRWESASCKVEMTPK